MIPVHFTKTFNLSLQFFWYFQVSETKTRVPFIKRSHRNKTNLDDDLKVFDKVDQ